VHVSICSVWDFCLFVFIKESNHFTYQACLAHRDGGEEGDGLLRYLEVCVGRGLAGSKGLCHWRDFLPGSMPGHFLMASKPGYKRRC
jgi:hypothetical protein